MYVRSSVVTRLDRLARSTLHLCKIADQREKKKVNFKVLLTDQGTLGDDDPIRKPAAYFNAMITRAKKGELNLHKSIFGILKREPIVL